MTERIFKLLLVLHLGQDLDAAAVVQGAARVARVRDVALPLAEIKTFEIQSFIAMMTEHQTACPLECGQGSFLLAPLLSTYL